MGAARSIFCNPKDGCGATTQPTQPTLPVRDALSGGIKGGSRHCCSEPHANLRKSASAEPTRGVMSAFSLRRQQVVCGSTLSRLHTCS